MNDPVPTVRVATYNIRNGLAWDGLRSWPLRRRATLATVQALGADVVGLQEVYWFQRRWLAAGMEARGVFGQGRNGGRRGEACPVMVCGAGVEVTGSTTRWFGSDAGPARLPGAGHRRIATVISGTVAGAAVWDFVNTHLDEKLESNRLAAAAAMASWLDPARPTVVMGDMNAVPGSPPLDILVEAGLSSVLADGGKGTAHRFTGRTDGPRLDHILVSQHLGVAASGVWTDRVRCGPGSDHWPVWADLYLIPT